MPEPTTVSPTIPETPPADSTSADFGDVKPHKASAVISRELPNQEELTQIKSILDSCKDEIAQLKYPTDDVIGNLRVVRFLRNSKGDTKKALKNFRLMLLHRVENNHLIEDLGHEVRGLSPKEFCEWQEKNSNPYLPVCPYIGESSDGTVYMWIRQGGSDMDKFIKKRPENLPLMDDLMCIIQSHEWLLWYLNDLSTKKKRLCYIVKLMDFGGMVQNPFVSSTVRNFMKTMMTFMGTDYCDADSGFVAMNTPTFYNIMLPIVKLIMTSRQKSKMSVQKADDFAASFFDKKLLPVSFGGSETSSAEVSCYKKWTDEETQKLLQTRATARQEYISRYPKSLDDLGKESKSKKSK